MDNEIPGTVERRILMRGERYDHSLLLVRATRIAVQELRMKFEDQWDPPDAVEKVEASILETGLQMLHTEIGGLQHAANVALYNDVGALLWEHDQR